MNIAFVINRDYLGPLKTTMYSLYLNNKNESFSVYIFESDLEESDYSNLNAFFNKIKSKVSFCKIDDSIFKNARKMKNDSSYTTYYKFFILDRLTNLDKVLYLDCDIVVNGDIHDFYYKEYQSLICAVKDSVIMSSNKKQVKRISGNKHNNYFNAGVLLFNIKNHEKECKDLFKQLIDYAINNRDILETHDQDVFNHFFHNSATYVNKKYNCFAIYNHLFQLIFPISFCTDKTIIHYVGFKPWKKGYIGFYKGIYKKYYKLTSEITDINFFEKQSLFYNIKNYFVMIRTQLHRFVKKMLGQ